MLTVDCTQLTDHIHFDTNLRLRFRQLKYLFLFSFFLFAPPNLPAGRQEGRQKGGPARGIFSLRSKPVPKLRVRLRLPESRSFCSPILRPGVTTLGRVLPLRLFDTVKLRALFLWLYVIEGVKNCRNLSAFVAELLRRRRLEAI